MNQWEKMTARRFTLSDSGTGRMGSEFDPYDNSKRYEKPIKDA